MNKEKKREMRCEQCGEKFECGVEAGDCWCFLLPLDRETLTKLNDKFDSCLCPECLLANQKSRK